MVRQILPPKLQNLDVPELNARKIGMVKSLERGHADKRVSTMQTGNPFELELVHHIPCKDPVVMERYWHHVFAKKRLSGEWFLVCEEDINEMCKVTTQDFETGNFPGNKEVLDEIVKDKNKKADDQESVPVTGSITALEMEATKVTFKIVKGILHRHRIKLKQSDRFERSHLTDEEFEIVMKALKKHPKADQKIGVGVTSIFVQPTLQYRDSYCFHVKRVDSSEEDFSYPYCFGTGDRKTHYSWK